MANSPTQPITDLALCEHCQTAIPTHIIHNLAVCEPCARHLAGVDLERVIIGWRESWDTERDAYRSARRSSVITGCLNGLAFMALAGAVVFTVYCLMAGN